MDFDALVTASEARTQLDVSLALICMWRNAGKIKVCGQRGRSPLYRWGDLLRVESETRRSDPAGQRRTA